MPKKPKEPVVYTEEQRRQWSLVAGIPDEENDTAGEEADLLRATR